MAWVNLPGRPPSGVTLRRRLRSPFLLLWKRPRHHPLNARPLLMRSIFGTKFLLVSPERVHHRYLHPPVTRLPLRATTILGRGR